MARDTERLVAHLRRRLGDNLRLVFEYDAGPDDVDTTVAYVRDDLPTDLLARRARLTARLYATEYRELVEASDDDVMQSFTASLQLFDIGLVLNLRDPDDPAHGVAFSFNYETGSQLVGFIEECSRTLYGEARHGTPDVPIEELAEES